MRGKPEREGQFSIWPSVREKERSNLPPTPFYPHYPQNAKLTCHSSLALAALGYGDPKKATLMVALMNNTCDLQPGRSELVNVALAFDYREYRKSVIGERGQDKARGY